MGARTRLGHLRLHDDVPRDARQALPRARHERGRLLARRAESPRGRHLLLGLLFRRRGARRLRLGGHGERASRAPGVRAPLEGGEVPRRRGEDARRNGLAGILRQEGRERRLPPHALRRPQARQQRGRRAAQLRRLLLPRGAAPLQPPRAASGGFRGLRLRPIPHGRLLLGERPLRHARVRSGDHGACTEGAGTRLERVRPVQQVRAVSRAREVAARLRGVLPQEPRQRHGQLQGRAGA